jgi:hypothetical protein
MPTWVPMTELTALSHRPFATGSVAHAPTVRPDAGVTGRSRQRVVCASRRGATRSAASSSISRRCSATRGYRSAAENTPAWITTKIHAHYILAPEINRLKVAPEG